MTNHTHTAKRSCWTTLAIALAIALVTIAFLYSMLEAQELPDPVGPIVIPTATMLPAPTLTPQDGDDFVIMTPVQWLPLLQNGGAHGR